jgi:RNA polymerase sigma-70 factor (ECF subfamily)
MIENTERLYQRLLVLRCQAGDETAFASLVEQYQPALRYYLRKVLSGVCDADDVLQEVWLDVFRSIARLVDADAFRGWLYQVARARALKQFRKRCLNFQPLDEAEATDAGSNNEAFTTEAVEIVHQAIDLLPAAQREVVVLRYIEGMSYEEIARIVGCQVGTVRSRLHYAKQALRTQLEKACKYE